MQQNLAACSGRSKPSTRLEAKLQGAARYFTGKPCKHGHITDRLVSGACVECNRLAVAKLRSNDPEGIRAYDRSRYASDPAKAKAYAHSRRQAFPELTREQTRRWVTQNRERTREISLRWTRQNPEKAAESRHRRRAARARAVPVWFGELDALVWMEASQLVQLRWGATGIRWHADHMVPLRSKLASGLHVWNNCQVIPAVMNSSKKQSMVLTEPFEWVGRV